MRTRRAAGAAARSHGAGFESYLDAVHARIPADVGFIRRHPQEMAYRGGPRKATGSDYCGVLCVGALVPVALEAKSRKDGRRLPIKADGDLKPASLSHLLDVARLGGVAVIAVRIRGGSARGDYLIPVRDNEAWERIEAREVTSIPLVGDESVQWGVTRIGTAGHVALMLEWCRESAR